MLTPFENWPDETPGASNRGDDACYQRRPTLEVDRSVHRLPSDSPTRTYVRAPYTTIVS
jgi:hypothetical protein